MLKKCSASFEIATTTILKRGESQNLILLDEYKIYYCLSLSLCVQSFVDYLDYFFVKMYIEFMGTSSSAD